MGVGNLMRVPNDFDFEIRVSEKSGELDAEAWAVNNGWLCRKISYIGRRSCPDRLFAGYGHLLIIEMKKKGGKLSKGQEEEFKRFAAVGVTVHVFYDGESAIQFLKSKMPAAELLV